MARKTKKTIRREPPLTRELLKLANDLDRINRRLLSLAEKVSDKEHDSSTLQTFLTKVSEGKGEEE